MEKTIEIMFSCVSCSAFDENTVRSHGNESNRIVTGRSRSVKVISDRVGGRENEAFLHKFEYRRSKSEIVKISEETAQRIIKHRISKYYERSKLHDSRKQEHKEKLEKLHNRNMEKL